MDDLRPACEHEDEGVFFDSEDLYTPEFSALAKSICATCPVFDWCEKTFAKEKHGIFFGKTPLERGYRVKLYED